MATRRGEHFLTFGVMGGYAPSLPALPKGRSSHSFMQPQGHLQVLLYALIDASPLYHYRPHSNILHRSTTLQTALDLPRFCIHGGMASATMSDAVIDDGRVSASRPDSHFAKTEALRTHRQQDLHRRWRRARSRREAEGDRARHHRAPGRSSLCVRSRSGACVSSIQSVGAKVARTDPSKLQRRNDRSTGLGRRERRKAR